jgi:flagellar hook-associated protein 2
MSDTPVLRLGGLASGMDTDSVVSQLMAVEKMPQTRILQQKTVEQARQSALRDVQTRLTNLQTAAAALTDATIWGDTQTVDSSDTSHVTATRTGGAPPGGYLVEVTQLARAAQSTSASLSSVTNSGTLTIQVGSGTSKDVSLNAGESLQAVADRINSTQDMGVYASVSNSKLVLSGKTTGDGNAISVTGGAAADFGFAETTSARSATVVVGDTVGADGHISGGTTLHPTSNIVTDAIPGVTLTLRGLTPLGSPAGITVGQPAADTGAVKDKVQALVDQYNSTIDFIRSKLNEQKVPNATTDADRAKGVLQGDTGLTSILTQLRRVFSDPVSGRPADLSQLAQAGLSTGSPSSGAINQDAVAGKLSLDPTKLTTMLQTRFSDVKALFTNAAAAGYGDQGLGQRLSAALGNQLNASNGALTLRLRAEQGQIDSLGKQYDAWNDRLATKEAQIRAQFTAMETALSQSQSLQASLASQIAGLPRYS